LGDLARALGWFWYLGGHRREGVRWLAVAGQNDRPRERHPTRRVGARTLLRGDDCGVDHLHRGVQRTRGSLLIAALFHFQLMNPVFPDAQPWDNLVLALAAAAVVAIHRMRMFTREGAVTDVLMREGREQDVLVREDREQGHQSLTTTRKP
jgi:hypothetical protein